MIAATEPWLEGEFHRIDHTPDWKEHSRQLAKLAALVRDREIQFARPVSTTVMIRVRSVALILVDCTSGKCQCRSAHSDTNNPAALTSELTSVLYEFLKDHL